MFDYISLRKALNTAYQGDKKLLIKYDNRYLLDVLREIRSFSYSLPKLNDEEFKENCEVLEAASSILNSRNRPIIISDPDDALITIFGGGRSMRPGQISLANNGVLVTFSRDKNLIKSLVTCQKNGDIKVVRKGILNRYPCKFFLIYLVKDGMDALYGSFRNVIDLRENSVE